MAKYHISPTTGRPNRCYAEKTACPLGGAHYDSKEEARAGYETENVATPAPLKKATTAGYEDFDMPLPGLRRGPENMAKTQERLQTFQQLSYERASVDGASVTNVYANGDFLVAAESDDELAAIELARTHGYLPRLREALHFDEGAAEELSDFLHGAMRDELEEEVEALEADRERNHGVWSQRQHAEYAQTLTIASLALAITTAENRKNKKAKKPS